MGVNKGTHAALNTELRGRIWGDYVPSGDDLTSVPQPFSITPLTDPEAQEGVQGIPYLEQDIGGIVHDLYPPMTSVEMTNAILSLQYFVGASNEFANGKLGRLTFNSGKEQIDLSPPVPPLSPVSSEAYAGSNYFRTGWKSHVTRLDELEFVSVKTKTINYQVLITDKVILGDATSGNIDITLPDPADAHNGTGSISLSISKIDSSLNTVTILPNASETIAGDASFVLAYQNEVLELITDGTNWYLRN